MLDSRNIPSIAGRLSDPYRRLDKRMDRHLLQQEVEFVGKVLEGLAPRGKLLDLCCGTGEVARMLQSTAFQTVGLDVNSLALAAFRQHLQAVPLIEGNALYLPFSDGSFDVIVALHCFDLLDRVGFLQECSRVLRSEGLLIFDALNRHSYKLILKRLGRLIAPLSAGRPSDKWIDVFSCREVLQHIGLANFDLQTVRGYGWPPFSVNSNSRLVNATASIERILHLNRLARVSPRILVAVRKKARY